MSDNVSKDKTNSIVSDSEEGLSGFDKSIHIEETTKQKEEDLKKKRIKDGIKNIAGLILQKAEFAILSSINYLAVYYAAYLSYKDKTIKKENSVSLGSIITFAQFSSIWSGGVLKEYVHMRIIIILGGSLLILGSLGIMFLNSLIGYKMMMALYGIGMGVQQGITNANACAYIPEKKGLINGIANISWTLFCSFFNYIGVYIINPEKKDVVLYDDVYNISGNVIRYTVITIFCFVGFTAATAILTFPYKKEKYLPKLESENINEDNNNIEPENINKDNNNEETEIINEDSNHEENLFINNDKKSLEDNNQKNEEEKVIENNNKKKEKMTKKTYHL